VQRHLVAVSLSHAPQFDRVRTLGRSVYGLCEEFVYRETSQC
jgi:hypothetical protein